MAKDNVVNAEVEFEKVFQKCEEGKDEHRGAKNAPDKSTVAGRTFSEQQNSNGTKDEANGCIRRNNGDLPRNCF